MTESKRKKTILIIAGIVAIAGITVILCFPPRARAQGQHTACLSNLKNLGTSLEMYAGDNGGQFPDMLDSLTPEYFKVIPTCPAAYEFVGLSFPKGSDYSLDLGFWVRRKGKGVYAYRVHHNPEIYTTYCESEFHTSITSVNFPQYDSIQGLIE